MMLFLAALLLALLLTVFLRKNRIYRLDVWLPAWLSWRLDRRKAAPSGRRDLIFCLVDHFEPGTQGASLERARARVSAWTKRYPLLAAAFRDSDGRLPVHTFFFPPHHHRDEYLRAIADLDRQGLAELELHLHHVDDDEASLRGKLRETIDLYARHGFLRTTGEAAKTAWGFVHGDWALANSRRGMCGVNDELRVLGEEGCYADFTFPSLHSSQPRMVNRLYRAKGSPDRPKGHDRGVEMAVDTPPDTSALPILTGPLGFRRRRRFPFLAVEDADVTGEAPGTAERVRSWVRRAIHVRGRPEWIFVKVHTHGAVERHHDALLGDGAAALLQTLCDEYADGDRWRLHFVSAREMFNIARAAEDGHEGDPDQFRDYEISPYQSRYIVADVGWTAPSLVLPAGRDGFPDLDWRALEGPATRLTIDCGSRLDLTGSFESLRLKPVEGGVDLLLGGRSGVLRLRARTGLSPAGLVADSEGLFEIPAPAGRRDLIELREREGGEHA